MSARRRSLGTLVLPLLVALAVLIPGERLAGSGEPVAKPVKPAKKEKPKEKKEAKDEKAEEAEESFDVYLDEDDDADRLLRLAARYADRKQWRSCLEKYLECLRLFGGKLTRAGGRDGELYESVATVVLRKMAATPKEGRDLWRLLNFGRFERRLKLACARGADPAEITEIARDFAGLEFSARALLVLGEARYARGDSAGAVDAWRRLLREYPTGDYPRIKLLGRTGLVAAEAGLVDGARAVLARLRKESALAEVNAGGSPMRLVEAIEKRLKARAQPSTAKPVGTAGGTWSLLGGDAARSRLAPPLTRPTMMRWRKELPVPPGWRGNLQRQYMMRYGMQTTTSKAWPFPGYHPAASGELVYLAGELGIMALRAHDGELVWHAPENEKGVATSCGLSGATVSGRRLLARQGRIFMGTNVYGMKLGDSLLRSLDPLTGKELRKSGALQAPLEIPKDEDEDLEDDAGDEKEEPEKKAPDAAGVNPLRPGMPADPQGRRTMFVGVPVLVGGTALCGVMRRSTQPEYELVAIDIKSGEVLWRTFLCGARPVTGPSPSTWGGASGALLSEIGQPPTLSGSSAYIVTNLGAVAALDVETGNLRWLRLYPRYSPPNSKPDPQARFMHRRNYQAPDRGTAKMWEPCAPVLAGGQLICAPQDCDYLLAIAPDTGRLIWRAPRVGMRRLLGVVKGRAVLSGADQVIVRDLANGKALWRRKLGARIIGHGTVGPDYVAVSTTRALEVLDLSGRTLFSYRWKQPKVEAGNVLVHGENVYTVSATHINAYCDMAAVTRRLAARSREKPGEALPRFLNGILALAGGKGEQAIATFEAALKLVKPGERYAGQLLSTAIKAKLWQCHWQLARAALKKDQNTAALKHLETALANAPDAGKAAQVLLESAACFRKLKRPAEALRAYHRLMSEYPEAPCARPDGSRLRAWLLAKGEVARVISEAGAEVYSGYEAKATALLTGATESGSAEDARKLAALYPNSKAASKALLLAARLAAEKGKSSLELSCLRQQIFLQGQSREGLQARKLLVEAYHRRGYYQAARRVLREMAAVKQQAGEALADFELPAARAELTGPPRPELAGALAPAWKLAAMNVNLAPGCAGDRQLIMTLRTKKNEALLVAVDAVGGKTLWRFDPLKAGLGALTTYQYAGREQVRVDGDAVIVSIGSKRAVIDRTSGKLRWKTEVRTQTSPYYRSSGNTTGRGKLYSCSDGVLVCWETVAKVSQLGTGERRRLLRAMSADDGRELWTVLVAKQADSRNRYSYGNSGKDGLMRTDTGRLAAWKYTAPNYSTKRTEQKTGLMTIDPASGRVTARFEAKGCAGLGLQRDRLICSDRQGKLIAYKLDGKKAWQVSGKWRLTAFDEESGRLIASTQTRSGNKYSTQLAAIDARGGKLLWKATRAGSTNNRYSYRSYGGNVGNNALVLKDRLIVAENARYMPYVHYYYAGSKSTLRAWDMKNGKQLWSSPFVPSNHTRAVGRKHLACAFNKVEQLDKQGQPIIRRRRNRWGAFQQPKQQEIAAVRMSTVVRLFNLEGGKAVREWVWTKLYKAPPGQLAMTWYPRSGGGKVTATPAGLVVTTPEGVVLLAPAKSSTSAGTPPASNSK